MELALDPVWNSDRLNGIQIKLFGVKNVFEAFRTGEQVAFVFIHEGKFVNSDWVFHYEYSNLTPLFIDKDSFFKIAAWLAFRSQEEIKSLRQIFEDANIAATGARALIYQLYSDTKKDYFSVRKSKQQPPEDDGMKVKSFQPLPELS